MTAAPRDGSGLTTVRLSGSLSDGKPWVAHVAPDVIALRIGDRACVAHKRWLTADEARDVQSALRAVSDD